MSLDQKGRFALVANYGTGTVASVAIGDGRAFCKGSNECPAASVVKVGGAPHSIYTSLDNKCALSPNIQLDVSFLPPFRLVLPFLPGGHARHGQQPPVQPASIDRKHIVAAVRRPRKSTLLWLTPPLSAHVPQGVLFLAMTS